MKNLATYERRQSADVMETAMLLASVAGVVTSVFVFLSYGWLLGVPVFLLSLVAFALSQLFDLMSELLGRIGRMEKNAESSPQAKEKIVS